MDLGRGMGTFLKISNAFEKGTRLYDDCLVYMGASLFVLINIISKKEYLEIHGL